MKSYAPIAWILCVLLGACASEPKEPPRIMMQGFSIAPPNEKEKVWVIAKKGPDLTIIGKPGRFSGESFTMQATIIKLPVMASIDELVKHVESTQRKELDPKRYRVFKFEVVPQTVHGQACTVSRVEAAERTAGDGTASPVNMMLETLTLICPHPKDPSRAINMAYSHRHFPEDVYPQLSEDGALLMKTLEFEPL